MAAVSLFWNSNMAAVTSSVNALITYIVQLKTRNGKISTKVYSRGSNLEVIDTRVLEYLEKLRGKDLYTFRRVAR